jgi:hypothetical protein
MTEYKPSRQPRDHADIDSVALGDIGQPFPALRHLMASAR